VDIFCRFIHDKRIRAFIAQEFAFTLDISKDQAAFFPIIHKPATSLWCPGCESVCLPLSPPFHLSTP
jgi:hypothetical protein